MTGYEACKENVKRWRAQNSPKPVASPPADWDTIKKYVDEDVAKILFNDPYQKEEDDGWDEFNLSNAGNGECDLRFLTNKLLFQT